MNPCTASDGVHPVASNERACLWAVSSRPNARCACLQRPFEQNETERSLWLAHVLHSEAARGSKPPSCRRTENCSHDIKAPSEEAYIPWLIPLSRYRTKTVARRPQNVDALTVEYNRNVFPGGLSSSYRRLRMQSTRPGTSTDDETVRTNVLYMRKAWSRLVRWLWTSMAPSGL